MMNFNQNAFTAYLTDAATQYRALQQQPKQQVTQQQAKAALSILDSITYNTPADLYLGAACINLLNTYVKQPNSTIGYWFKNYVYPMMDASDRIPMPGLCWSFTIDRRMTVGQLDFFGLVQFSYHCIKRTSSIDRILARQAAQGVTVPAWDGIRKQMCACTVFETALEAHRRWGTPLSAAA